jgi:hypothetical protein
LSVLMCRIVDSMFWACWLAARRSACSIIQGSSTSTNSVTAWCLPGGVHCPGVAFVATGTGHDTQSAACTLQVFVGMCDETPRCRLC